MMNQKICNAFSKAAGEYDRFTDIHRQIGRELMEKVRQNGSVECILDVGMGTGWVTGQLVKAFPDARVIGLDFASGMIAHACQKGEQFKIVQADASCLPFQPDIFDIITSNLAYQWVDNLPSAFTHCQKALKKNGVLYFTMFGRKTFKELFEAFNSCLEKKERKMTRHLADKSRVAASLAVSDFSYYHVESRKIKVLFSDMLGLMKWIKNIGANSLSKSRYLGRDLLFKANNSYNRRFKDEFGVYATFEVISVEARK